MRKNEQFMFDQVKAERDALQREIVRLENEAEAMRHDLEATEGLWAYDTKEARAKNDFRIHHASLGDAEGGDVEETIEDDTTPEDVPEDDDEE